MAAYEAALAISALIDPDEVLERITHLAREVVPARYAALGVADAQGKIHTFITSGISLRQRRALGDIPQGHGLIGELIRNREPIMIPDISADPRSVGFPVNHPPMHALLGVPILLGETVLGNLYLTEPEEGETFAETDLAALRIMSVHAAQAIDRAQLLSSATESQRRAEEQRDHLRVILNSMGTAVLIQDSPNGQVELVNNAARSLLLDTMDLRLKQPMAGRDYQILHANGSALPREQWPARRAWRGEMVRSMQVTFLTPSDRRIPVLAQAAPLRNSEGEVTRVVIVFQDVTRLREAEQLKDDFLSLVSHELRTPLTAIHGGAYVLANQGEAIDDQTRHEILTDLVTESERLDRTLRNMLTLTAIQAGQMDPETEPVLIGQHVRRHMHDASSRVPNHDFAVECAEGIPPAEANPELLGHVLGNLYENAVKYSPSGTTVHTSVRFNGQTISISITDQGVGIDPAHVSEVFERFRRPGADPAVRGMGLGLYLSRHLIEAQGGTISATSPGVGKGATFTITLPVAEG